MTETALDDRPSYGTEARGDRHPHGLPSDKTVLVLLTGHAVLGLLMNRYVTLAHVHFYAVALAGAYAARRRHLRHVVLVVAYCMASGVLWRKTDAAPIYEGAKYLASGLMILSLLWFPGRVRLKMLPLMLFAVLLPSTLVTLSSLPLRSALDQISFYLSGPFAMVVASLYFQQLRLEPREVAQVTLAILAPIVAMGAIVATSTLEASVIEFAQESNFVTSGGFGPNQVSSVLGLGALVAFLLALHRGLAGRRRILMLVLSLAFATQSALTFSRGGILTAFGAAVVALIFQFRERRYRVGILVSATVIYFVGRSVILPQLDGFTGGAIIERFQDIRLETRERFIEAEFYSWSRHRVLGLGPGGSREVRREATGVAAAAHTEVTRLISEHGLFGVAAIAVFLLMGFQLLRRQDDPSGRAWCAAFLTFTILYSFHSAMRTALPALTVGLASARLRPYLRTRERGGTVPRAYGTVPDPGG